MTSQYLTVEAVAQHLGVSESLIYKKIKSGAITPVLRLSQRLIRIPISTLKAIEEGKICLTPNVNNLDYGSAHETVSGTSSTDQEKTPDPFRHVRETFTERKFDEHRS